MKEFIPGTASGASDGDGAHSPSQQERCTPLDLAELRQRAQGSGTVFVCRHPDVEDQPANGPDRYCVLDVGRRQDCDIAAEATFRKREKCRFWLPMQRVASAGASPSEVLALLDLLARATGPASTTGGPDAPGMNQNPTPSPSDGGR